MLLHSTVILIHQVRAFQPTNNVKSTSDLHQSDVSAVQCCNAEPSQLRRRSNADWWAKPVNRKYLVVRKKNYHKNTSKLFHQVRASSRRMSKQRLIYVGPASQRLNAATPNRRSSGAALTPIGRRNMSAENIW